jgi:hypothetical protein
MLNLQSVDHKRPLFYILQVDCATLERQIAEQRAWKQEQRRKDEAFDEQRIRDAKMALLLERKIEEVMSHLALRPAILSVL